jgi:DNA-binding IclR family transcriptional regulator
MTPAERKTVCGRVVRALQAIQPASYTAVMHRAGLSMSTTVDALRFLEEKGFAVSSFLQDRNAPEMWSLAPKSSAQR